MKVIRVVVWLKIWKHDIIIDNNDGKIYVVVWLKIWKHDIATVDGAPANGEYLMPDGTTYVFEEGILTQIIEAGVVEVDEITALKEENARIKQENEDTKDKLAMVMAKLGL